MMPFKLESILKLKKQVEDQRKRELSMLNTQKQQVLDQQYILENRCQEHLENYKEILSENLRPNLIMQMHHFIKKLENEKEVLNEKLKGLEAEIETSKLKVKEAMKDRKVIENLKEIHVKNVLELERYKEQQRTDEVVSYKYSERRGEDG